MSEDTEKAIDAYLTNLVTMRCRLYERDGKKALYFTSRANVVRVVKDDILKVIDSAILQELHGETITENPVEKESPTFTGIEVRLSSFTEDVDSITDKTFVDCTIVGPAIVHFTGVTHLEDCSFGGSEFSTFITTEQSFVMGGIALENCRFKGCTFKRIGIIGGSEYIDKIKRGFVS